jgi:hypothetical protein
MTNAEARTTTYRRENLASKTRNHTISMKEAAKGRFSFVASFALLGAFAFALVLVGAECRAGIWGPGR